jgi:hypothetical protein
MDRMFSRELRLGHPRLQHWPATVSLDMSDIDLRLEASQQRGSMPSDTRFHGNLKLKRPCTTPLARSPDNADRLVHASDGYPPLTVDTRSRRGHQSARPAHVRPALVPVQTAEQRVTAALDKSSNASHVRGRLVHRPATQLAGHAHE